MVCKFISTVDDAPKELSRKGAKQYNLLQINAKTNDFVDIDYTANKIVLNKVKANTKDVDVVYFILCNKIGFTDYASGKVAKFNILFCNDDYMLITLFSGTLFFETSKGISTYSVGLAKEPKIKEENILWKTKKEFVEFVGYWDILHSYLYDFHFMVTVKGGIKNDVSDFMIKLHKEDSTDFTKGEYAKAYEQYLIKTQKELELKKMLDKKMKDAYYGKDKDKNKKSAELDYGDE